MGSWYLWSRATSQGTVASSLLSAVTDKRFRFSKNLFSHCCHVWQDETTWGCFFSHFHGVIDCGSRLLQASQPNFGLSCHENRTFFGKKTGQTWHFWPKKHDKTGQKHVKTGQKQDKTRPNRGVPCKRPTREGKYANLWNDFRSYPNSVHTCQETLFSSNDW